MELTDAVMQRPGEQHLQVMDNTSVCSGIDAATVTTSNIMADLSTCAQPESHRCLELPPFLAQF